MATRSAIINVMTKAATKAARGLKRDFGEVEQLQVTPKGPSDFVSAADHRAEAVIKETLRHARPDFGLLMEKSGEHPGKDPRSRFIVDPLDGTTNFLHGLPHFAISIACERDGEIVAGIVFDPIKNELFWAEKGMGAYLNDRRLRVSGRRRLAEALLATGIPFQGHGDRERFLKEIDAAMQATAGVRRYGSAALDLAYVAAGRYDAFWERHLSPWDMAAGVILVREAGGLVSEIEGGDWGIDSASLLVANDKLHRACVTLLSGGGP